MKNFYERTAYSEIILQEALNVYYMILSVSTDSNTQIITGANLSKFLNSINSSEEESAIQILHEIDEIGQVMNKDNFPSCLANKIKVQLLFSENDIDDFHKTLKKYFMRQPYQTPDELYNWDGISTQDITNSQFQNYITVVYEQFLTQQKLFETDKESFFRILNGRLLPIIKYYYSLQTESIIDTYKKILRGKTLQNIVMALYTVNLYEINEALKSLCYLFEGYQFKKLKIDYHNNYLMNEQNKLILWEKVTEHLNNQNYDVKKHAMILIAISVKNFPEFCNYLQMENYQILSRIYSQVYLFTDPNIMYYGMMFFKYWIKHYRILRKMQNLNDQNNIVSLTFRFTFQTLTKINDLKISVICLQVIHQCLLNMSLQNQNQIKLLSMIPQCLNLDINLQKQTLKIIYSTIKNKYVSIYDYFIESNEFRKFMSQNLNILRSYDGMFCISLNILYELSRGQRINHFYDGDYIEKLQLLISQGQPFVCNLISKIYINLIQDSFSSQWKMSYLIKSQIVQNLCRLTNTCQNPNKHYLIYWPELNHTVDLSPVIFKNSFICLYLMSTVQQIINPEVAKRKISCFLEGLTENSFTMLESAAKKFFSHPNRNIAELCLRQQIEIMKQTKMKFYKLISLFFEELTRNLGKKSFEEGKRLSQQIRKLKFFYYTGLYFYIPVAELEALKIPIILIIQMKYGSESITFKVFKNTFTEFKELITQKIRFWNQELENQELQITDNFSNQVISNQSTFNKILNQIFKYYRDQPQFKLSITVRTIVLQRNIGSIYFSRSNNPNNPNIIRQSQFSPHKSAYIPRNISPNFKSNQYKSTYINNNFISSPSKPRCKKCGNSDTNIIDNFCRACR